MTVPLCACTGDKRMFSLCASLCAEMWLKVWNNGPRFVHVQKKTTLLRSDVPLQSRKEQQDRGSAVALWTTQPCQLHTCSDNIPPSHCYWQLSHTDHAQIKVLNLAQFACQKILRLWDSLHLSSFREINDAAICCQPTIYNCDGGYLSLLIFLRLSAVSRSGTPPIRGFLVSHRCH